MELFPKRAVKKKASSRTRRRPPYYKKMEKRDLIGHILVELGYISLVHVNEARRRQMTRPEVRLGEILVDMEALTPVQLMKGLELQKIEREIIGQQPA